MPLVLDASVALAWAFDDEATPYTDRVQTFLETDSARAPAIWPLEIMNVLLMAERRNRFTLADTVHFVGLLRDLPIEVDYRPFERIASDALDLARTQSLTIYDASYLELAVHSGLPLATLDTRLRSAARAIGVPLFQ